MADGTNIEWVRALAASIAAIPATWNPIDGCSRASRGCENCWSAALVHTRLSKSLPRRYAGLTEVDGNGVPRFNGTVRLHEPSLMIPVTAKKPRVYFAPSMADPFHPALSDAHIDRIMAVVALCPRHVFLLLTKRPERAAAYFRNLSKIAATHAADTGTDFNAASLLNLRHLARSRPGGSPFPNRVWPLPNLWLGTTVEDQRAADERIPHLLDAPAAKRFLSMEPLLGPVDLTRIDPLIFAATANALTGRWRWEGGPTRKETPGLDWIIAGEESGPGARRTESGDDTYRSLRDQCSAAGVPFMLKQRLDERGRVLSLPPLDGVVHNAVPARWPAASPMAAE